MKLHRTILGIAALLACAAPLFAQKAYTPANGAAERKQFMNLLRGAVIAHYGKYFEGDPPVFTVRHLKVSGAWAYAEVTTQEVLAQPNDEVLENMSSLDANAGSRDKAAKWTIDAWALYQKNGGEWEIVFHSTDERAKDYEMSLDDGRIEAYKDMRKKYPRAPLAIFPQ
jgi:hypothetical protein